MGSPIDELTDKEREVLRLIVRGHDAKTAAGELGVSVHTINERLRTSRRKLGVTSSREAARLLLENEGDGLASHTQSGPQLSVPKQIGGDGSADANDLSFPLPGTKRAYWIGGSVMLTTVFAGLAFLMAGSGEAPASVAAESQTTASQDLNARYELLARDWLKLVDQEDWQASHAAAGRVFREANSVRRWREASEFARGSFGGVVTRKAIGFQEVPSPEGYQVVQFQTRFENKAQVIETVTLQPEGGTLRVVGYFLN